MAGIIFIMKNKTVVVIEEKNAIIVMLTAILIIRFDKLYLRLIKKNGKGVKYEKKNITGPNILYPRVITDGIIPANIDKNILFFNII
tara:strand:- start:647 stop:907 length:261 start_codon:yes stop_codon:yes gene_type:complete